MKNKKLAVFVLIIGILLIVCGLSIGVYTYLNKKNQDTQELYNQIIKKYDVFKSNVESFNDKRSIYYNKVAKNLYPESVETAYTDWIQNLNLYTETVDKVEASSEELKEYCVNKYYSDNNIKNKCESFVIAYETVINYYTKDVIAFNDTIDLYFNNSIENKSDIKKYNLNYEYTDVNLDGKFIGKD